MEKEPKNEVALEGFRLSRQNAKVGKYKIVESSPVHCKMGKLDEDTSKRGTWEGFKNFGSSSFVHGEPGELIEIVDVINNAGVVFKLPYDDRDKDDMDKPLGLVRFVSWDELEDDGALKNLGKIVLRPTE